MTRYFEWLATVLFFGALLFTAPVSAFTLGAGCRVPTQQDLQALADRGIPPIAQICPADDAALGIGKSFEEWYAQLKSQSPCNKNTCTLSCRTRNTGAQVCGPTATRWNSIGCHPNNNTAIFPTVSHGFAAHIELLRRYCAERGRCTIDRVVGQWTAVVADRPAYAAFISRNSGIPTNEVFDPNNTDLVGRLAMSMSCFEAGALPYNVSELKQGLDMAAGGAKVAVPSNVGELLNESLQGGYAPNPPGSPNSHPESWRYAPLSGYGSGGAASSPFANASPVSLSNPRPVSQDILQNINGGQAQVQQGPPGPSAGGIIVQPRVVAHGKNVVVSWTSVNMNTAANCQVLRGGQQFAHGAEGTKSYKTKDSETGVLTFILQCTTQTGTQFEARDSITVN